MTSTIVTPSSPRNDALVLSDGDSLDVQANANFNYFSTGAAVLWTGGTSTVTVNGSISTAQAGSLGIDEADGVPDKSSFSIMIGANGSLKADGDAIRARNTFDNGSITLDNAGLVQSQTGEALDFSGMTSTSTLLKITNEATGTIKALNGDAIRPGADSLIYNYGTISGQSTGASTSNGINFLNNSANTALNLFNYQGGTITGALHGVTGTQRIGIDNAGTITGQAGTGIDMETASGSTTNIINEATGLINGINVNGQLSLDNYGTINAYVSNGTSSSTDARQPAVRMDGGTLFNESTGHIYSDHVAIAVARADGKDADSATLIDNKGDIKSASGQAVSVTSNQNTILTNEGTIEGSIVFQSVPGDTSFANNTITNSGTITGSVSTGNGNDTFNERSGAVVTGTIDGGAGIDTLNLMSNPVLSSNPDGTLSNVQNFETLNVAGDWTLEGGDGFSSGINISGELTIKGGFSAASLNVPITGNYLTIDRSDTVTFDNLNISVLTVEGGGTVRLQGNSVASTFILLNGGTADLATKEAVPTWGEIEFIDGAPSTLKFSTQVDLNLKTSFISNFGSDDKLDFVGYDLSTIHVSYQQDILSVTDGQGHHQSVTLYTHTNQPPVFEVGASSDGVFLTIACYGLGTLIETAQGETPVEALAIGDLVRTLSGALRPIKWIGTRSYAGRFIAMNRGILPICFKAASLGENSPRRDLLISPHHAMYIDGLLIEAKDLVNGVSIVQTSHVERVDYFHIELDSHDVIIAEGALSETFIDDESRAMFHNAMEYRALYPNEAPVELLYCAPRINEGEALEAVRAKLEARFKVSEAA